MSSIMDTMNIVQALAPDADRYTTDPATDVVALTEYRRATFLVYGGVGTTGTAVATVESCDDFTPTTATAVAFRYKVNTTGNAWGAWQTAAAAGFTIAAGSNYIYAIEVNASDLSGTNPNVRLKLTEGVDAPQDAAVICIMSDARYPQDVPISAIA